MVFRRSSVSKTNWKVAGQSADQVSGCVEGPGGDVQAWPVHPTGFRAGGGDCKKRPDGDQLPRETSSLIRPCQAEVYLPENVHLERKSLQ